MILLIKTGLFLLSCLVTAFLVSTFPHNRNGDWDVDSGSGLLPDHIFGVTCREDVGRVIDLPLHLLLLHVILRVKRLGINGGILIGLSCLLYKVLLRMLEAALVLDLVRLAQKLVWVRLLLEVLVYHSVLSLSETQLWVQWALIFNMLLYMIGLLQQLRILKCLLRILTILFMAHQEIRIFEISVRRLVYHEVLVLRVRDRDLLLVWVRHKLTLFQVLILQKLLTVSLSSVKIWIPSLVVLHLAFVLLIVILRRVRLHLLEMKSVEIVSLIWTSSPWNAWIFMHLKWRNSLPWLI